MDFTSPTFGTATATALDGNAAANRIAISATIPVSIAAGQEVWLRWKDIDHTGNDHALAITVNVTPTLALDSDGQAALKIGSLGAGVHVLTLSYEGDETSTPITAANGPSLTQIVNKATPLFSGLTAKTIEAGTSPTVVSGVFKAGGVAPLGSVGIAVNGVTQFAGVGADGSFSSTFATETLQPSAAAYVISYSYTGDDNFETATGTGSLKVVDTIPPSIAAVTASPALLDPPNHKMADVTLAYASTDLGADGHTIVSLPTCSLSVASNEPVNSTGDGNTTSDWQVIDTHHVQVRSERAGTGAGRVYTITVTCTDGSHNPNTATAVVRVPKNP